MSIIGDKYRVTVNITAPAASLVQNVYHFRHEGIAGVADSLLVSGIGTYMATLYGYILGVMDSDVDVVDADIVRVDDLGDQIADLGSVNIGVSGSVVGSVCPPAVSMLISSATGVTGVFASKYLGGLSKNAFTEGVLTAACLAAAANYITNWLAGFTASGTSFKPGVISSKTGGFLLLGASGSVTNEIAYQRRRKFTVGA